MDLELNEKVAVVTDASKGIGLSVTRLLAAEGAYVIAGARSVDSLVGIDPRWLRAAGARGPQPTRQA